MSYIGNEPIVSATRTVTEISATAGQTTFTANGGYTIGKVDVIVNGSQLQSSDFTATDGSTVVLTSACASGDDVKLVAWGTFTTSGALQAANNLSDLTNAATARTNLGVDQTGPAFSVYMSANQTPSNNVLTKCVLDTEIYDTASCFNTSTYRFTPNVAGYYQINATVSGYSSNTSLVANSTILQKNGTTIFAVGQILNVSSCLMLQPSASGIVYLNGSTDYVELYGQVNVASGGSQLFVGTSALYTTMSGCLIKAA